MDARQDHAELLRDGLLSIVQAAAFLGVGRTTVYVLMESGQLQFVKIRKCRRIPKRALIEVAARNLRGGWRAP